MSDKQQLGVDAEGIKPESGEAVYSAKEASGKIDKSEGALSDLPIDSNLSSLSSEERSEPSLAEILVDPRNVKGEINRNLRWYVLHSYSGFEEKAKSSLLLRAKERGLESLIGMIHVPQLTHETKTKTGKTKLTSRTSFPGYLITQLELNDATKLLIKETPKITGFVGDSRNPRPLPDSEVKTLLSIESDDVEASSNVVEVLPIFVKGDIVKVKDGPFTNFDGLIDVVRAEKSKARVLVSIFGRETPVELDFKQIEKI